MTEVQVPDYKKLLTDTLAKFKEAAETAKTVATLKAKLMSLISKDLNIPLPRTLRTKVSDGEWQRLGQVAPVPGMPVEAFIQTGQRSASPI